MDVKQFSKDMLKRPEFWGFLTPASYIYLTDWLHKMQNLNVNPDNRLDAWATALTPLLLMAGAGFGSVAVNKILDDKKRKKGLGLYLKKEKKSLGNLPKTEKNIPSFLKHTALGTVAYYARQYEMMERALDKAREANPESILPYLGKADVCLQKGDREGVLLNLRASLRAYKRAGRKMGSITSFSAAERCQPHPFRSDDPLNFLSTAMYNYFYKREERSLQSLQRAVKLAEDNPDYQLFAAELLEEIVDTAEFSKKAWFELREKLWEEATSKIQREELESFGESRNKVYQLRGNRFAEDIFILKEGKAESLRSEMATSAILQGIVEQYSEYFVSKPLTLLDDDTLCVIRREPGRNLHDMIKEGEETSHLFPAIVDILAIIHAQFPKERAGDKENIRKSLESKLDKTRTSNAIKAMFRWNYEPIEESFADSNFVYNKDAHPENWRYGDNGQIGVLDCEQTRQIPQSCDMANLMDYMRHLSEQEKDTLLQRYRTKFNEEGGEQIKDHRDFRLKYYNARIHRAIALNAAMQDRPNRQEERKAVLKSAEIALRNIRIEAHEYYDAHRSKYNDLEQGLFGLMIQNEEGCGEIRTLRNNS